MFRRREKAKALLFEFDESTNLNLTSFFVFFPFIVIWLDDKNEIIEIRKIQPFQFIIFPKKPFKRIIEIPINQKYKDIVKLLELSLL